MYPEITTLLPHRPPMLLLDALTNAQDRRIEACFTVRANNIFLRDDGTLEGVALLEAMAQCLAAGNGLHTPGRIGYLAAVRHCQITGAARLGDDLCATATLTAQVGNIHVVESCLTRAGEVLARAEFKVYTPTSSPDMP